ncbi:MAG: RNA 2',3'-cyclic phosphodiesterase [Alcanivoracaceae bacterium]|jgi:2'-5' RNA ligase|nr:RNA 2',3'-cyclic phosphodiesterase [Alcanivoracaceae bacterium]
MRCFVGVPVEPLLGVELLSLRDDMLAGLGGGCPRAVPAANFHLTLAFLGEQPDDSVTLLDALLAELAGRHHALVQPLEQVSLFPDNRARLLAAHGPGTPALLSLAEDLQQRLADTLPGYQPERRTFRPHVTLARLDLPVVPAPLRVVALPLRVEALVLYRSDQVNGKTVYRLLRQAELPGARVR